MYIEIGILHIMNLFYEGLYEFKMCTFIKKIRCIYSYIEREYFRALRII